MMGNGPTSFEVGSYDGMAPLLSLFEPVEPDESVWRRIEDAISSEPQAGRGFGRRSWLLVATASAAAGFVAGLLAGPVTGTGLEPSRFEAVASMPGSATIRLADDAGSELAAIAIGSDGSAVFSGASLPGLEGDQTYQLWAVVGGEVISAGLLGPEPTEVPLRLEAGPVVLAITIEESGGVVVSEQDPVAVWAADK